MIIRSRPTGRPSAADPVRRHAPGRSARPGRRALGALAAAALAATIAAVIAPAAPAGAVTPSTAGNRIQGANRYATSAALATAFVAARTGTTTATWGGNLLIAAGTNFPDALAAASVASARNAPILLVPSDGSLPSAVRDWLVANRATIQSKATPTVTVVGGTAAVPSATVTTIVDLLNEGLAVSKVTATRLSGTDRYATAAAAAQAPGVIDAADAAIVVSGQNFADAVSVAPLAFAMGWPIILTPQAGLNASARAALAAFRAASIEDLVFIVGGPAAVSVTVEEQIVSEGFDYPSVRRVYGDDRYATSAEVVDLTIGYAGPQFDGSRVALVTGENFADAVAAAPFLAADTREGGGIALQLTRSASLSPAASQLFTLFAGSGRPSELYAIGGTSAVSDGVVAAAVAAAQSTNLVGQIACPAGLAQVTVRFSGPVDSTEESFLDESYITVNGAAGGGGALPAAQRVSDDRRTATFNVGAVLRAGDVVRFTTNPEIRSESQRTLSAPACTVADDRTAPRVIILASPNSDGVLFIAADEPVIISDGAVTSTTPGATDSEVSLATLDRLLYEVVLTNGTDPVPLARGAQVRIPAGVVRDLAGNTNLEESITVPLDDTMPSFTMRAVGTPFNNAEAVAGGLVLAARDGGEYTGSAGNGWRLSVVNQRGLVIPRVVANAAARTVTVTVDVTTSDGDDVARAAINQRAIPGWMLYADGGALSSTATPGITSGGTDAVSITLRASELMPRGNLAVFSASVNGSAVMVSGFSEDDMLMGQMTFTTYSAQVLNVPGGELRLRLLPVSDYSGNVATPDLTATIERCSGDECLAVP